MHTSNLSNCFYSRRGYGSYGSLWKVHHIWGVDLEPFLHVLLVFIAKWCNADRRPFQTSQDIKAPLFISWGELSVTIKIWVRPYLTEVSDVRSELPVWSQREEQVDVRKGPLCLTTQYARMSGELFFRPVGRRGRSVCFIQHTTAEPKTQDR